MTKHIIKTKVDPKDFRTKYKSIPVLDGDLSSTATTEIINEDVELATGIFTMEIALYYPHRSTRNTISLAFPARKDGKMVGIQPPDYMLTQEDFEAVLRGEVIKVPTHY